MAGWSAGSGQDYFPFNLLWLAESSFQSSFCWKRLEIVKQGMMQNNLNTCLGEECGE